MIDQQVIIIAIFTDEGLGFVASKKVKAHFGLLSYPNSVFFKH